METRRRSQRKPLQVMTNKVKTEETTRSSRDREKVRIKNETPDKAELPCHTSKNIINKVSHEISNHHSAGSTLKKRPGSPLKEEQQSKVVKVEMNEEDNESSDSEMEEDLKYYEQMRENNLKDNEAFFSSLGIDQVKECLKRSVVKTYFKPAQKREPKMKEILPKRRSLRIQRIDPQGAPLPPLPEPEPVVEEHPRVPAGPVNMVEVIETEEEEHAPFAKSIAGLNADSCQFSPCSSDLSSFVSDMKKMHIRIKAKVCKDRLFSVAVHPTTDKVIAMAGDKWGRLGLWDINPRVEDQTVVTYRPHSRPVGNIVVPPTHPQTVYTCSYDSTLRCGDFEKGIFDELYSVPEENDDLFRNFDFLSPSSLIVAQFRGDVAVVDTRTPKNKAEKLFYVCDKYLRTVSVHPTNKHFFVTAGTDMKASLWDMRKLSPKGNKPLHVMQHGRAVSSAYFSPLTGCRLLTCCADDTLNIYDCSSSCGEVKRAKTISHNNKTGRWLTPFRSVWHPAREDVFFVGSMKTPRRMEAFGVDGRVLHEFQGEVLSSVCSVVQCHPSRNILVGGNSSGYIFPFM